MLACCRLLMEGIVGLGLTILEEGNHEEKTSRRSSCASSTLYPTHYRLQARSASRTTRD